MYVDPVNNNTCPSIRDLTEDYYGKIAHRFNSASYSSIPWHMPSKKLHVIGYARFDFSKCDCRFDESNKTIKETLLHLFSNYGHVDSITVLRNVCLKSTSDS